MEFRNYILPEILDSANRPLFIAGGYIDNRLKRFLKKLSGNCYVVINDVERGWGGEMEE
jgi:hypothetical protein